MKIYYQDFSVYVDMEQDEVKEIFYHSGFCLQNDFKRLKVSKAEQERIKKDIITFFDAKDFFEAIRNSPTHEVSICRVRVANDKGKSSGYRVVILILKFDKEKLMKCYPIQISSKKGTHSKDNLNQNELNKLKQLVNKLDSKLFNIGNKE